VPVDPGNQVLGVIRYGSILGRGSNRGHLADA
jgi:hypothetical protein